MRLTSAETGATSAVGHGLYEDGHFVTNGNFARLFHDVVHCPGVVAVAPCRFDVVAVRKRTHSIVREHILAALAPGTAASGSSLFRVESLGFRV